jgi:hypothetical protein
VDTYNNDIHVKNENNVKNNNNENKQIEKIKNTWMRYQNYPELQGLLSFKSHDDRMNEYIEKQLQYADVEEIEQAIKNFGQIAGNENYYGYKPCTIHEFMKRNDLQSFFDSSNPLENKKIKEFKKQKTESQKKDDWYFNRDKKEENNELDDLKKGVIDIE